MKKPKPSPFDDLSDEFEEEIQEYVKKILKTQHFAMINSQDLFYWIEIDNKLYFISPDSNQAVERATQRVSERHMLMVDSEFVFNENDERIMVQKINFYVIETQAYLLN